jgi:uncharacterized protein
MTSTYEKPIPLKTPLNAPHFEGSLEGRIRLQRASSDGTFRCPYSPVNPGDLSTEATWTDLSGRATLWSWVVMHQGYLPSFKADVPYPVILVKLAEGPFMISTIPADVDIADLRVDMPMQVEFEPATDELAIAKFRPVTEPAMEHVAEQ